MEQMAHALSAGVVMEVIPKRLFWAALPAPPQLSDSKVHCFNIDEQLVYEGFNQDFGPLNIASVHRYCDILDQKLNSPQLKDTPILHFCSQDPRFKANAYFLVCAYQVVVQGKSAEEAWEPVRGMVPALRAYRDATAAPCSYKCTILDCLRGLEYAMMLGWFGRASFRYEQYQHLSNLEGGDMNWLVPGKFLAFTGPSGKDVDEGGFPCLTPEACVPIFQDLEVTLVIRLNRKQYDRRVFIEAGIRHVDLYFPDGTCPPQEVIEKFLTIVEQEKGAVAVHCKAGLGRTATLIGLWCMKWHRFPARGFVAWSRIMRPGSILGSQQQYLSAMEEEMFRVGDTCRSELGGTSAQLSLDLVKTNKDYEREEVEQGEGLVSAKRLLTPSLGRHPASASFGSTTTTATDGSATQPGTPMANWLADLDDIMSTQSTLPPGSDVDSAPATPKEASPRPSTMPRSLGSAPRWLGRAGSAGVRRAGGSPTAGMKKYIRSFFGYKPPSPVAVKGQG